MLVLLQSDLSRQGVPTGAKGVCGSCQKPIAGKVGFGVLLGEGGRKKRCLVYPKVGVPCWSLKMRGWGGGWSSGVPQIGFSFVRGLNRGGRAPKIGLSPTSCTPKTDLTRPGTPKWAVIPWGPPPTPFFFLFFFVPSPTSPPPRQVVRALGCAWHPEHFVCARCGGELGGGSFFEKDGAPYCPRGLRTPLLPPLRPLCPTHPRRGSGGPWGRDGGSWRQRDLFGGSWGVVGPPLGWWETLRWIGTLWGALEAEEPTGGGPWDPVGCRGTSWGAVG